MNGRGEKKIKVLCALSGGVDSAVSAALLVKQGYDVTAAFMINYRSPSSGLRPASSEEEFTGRSVAETCWLPEYRDAVRVAAKLRIPIIRLDFTKEYKKMVLDYMFKEYESGRTPNPDILCNKFVKFGSWLEKAKELGFDFLATGHYARISRKSIKSKVHKVRLLEAKDKNKDQTYFLHQLTQEQLKYVLFPVGDYTKPQVRAMAKKLDLPVANKEESMGICFIGEVPMKEFLQTRIKPKPGKIVLPDGTVVGAHEGLAFYTIGQRHIGLASPPFQGGARGGLPSLQLPRVHGSVSGIKKTSVLSAAHPEATPPSLPLERGGSDTRPLYVLDKRVKTNELVVGFEDDPLLYTKEILVSDVNWICPPTLKLRRGEGGQTPKFPLQCEVRLRHRQELQRAVVIGLQTSDFSGGHNRKSEVQSPKSKVRVTFATPQRAVTPGQFAVFYKKGECLGGGVIVKEL